MGFIGAIIAFLLIVFVIYLIFSHINQILFIVLATLVAIFTLVIILSICEVIVKKKYTEDGGEETEVQEDSPSFAEKFVDKIKSKLQCAHMSEYEIEQYAKECNAYVVRKEREEQNQALIEEKLISEVNSKIDKINELAVIINKTTNREEFYNCVKEIEDILTKLSEKENELDFPFPPSVHLKDFRKGKPKRIELLEKRIAEKEKEVSQLSSKYKDDKEILVEESEPENMKEEQFSKEVEKNFDIEDRQDIVNTNKINNSIEIINEILSENSQEDIQNFEYILPPINLLSTKQCVDEDVKERKEKLKQTFEAFRINMDIVDISKSARFTRFEIQIGQGIRIKDILKIKDDIQLNLAASNLSIIAPISGKTTIGIDVENNCLSAVALREMIESEKFHDFRSNLAIAIGKDITGNIIVESLENMWHLLIGGTTGSGKSVCINSIIMSILFKARPDEVKLILIDTKAVNLTLYNGIPHLLIPVVTDLKKSTVALHWGIVEMNDRYKKFADIKVKDLKGYNEAVDIDKFSYWGEPLQKMPNIVIVIDDFSDLMTRYNNKIEESVCRLAQMGRAAGIHLVISTQRPYVDVITGTIKANIPSRIAFNVFSAIDSRTILDEKGAEDLLSDGDMLFLPFGARKPIRVQGTFVLDEEIENVVNFIKNQIAGNVYSDNVEKKVEKIQNPYSYSSGMSEYSGIDELFEKAGSFVIEHDKASIGMLQRYLKIGFNRAARIVDQLEEAGVVGPEEGTKPRRILMSIEQFEKYIKDNL